MNAVTCLTWIKRGIAKANPDKVRLTADELSQLLKSSGKSERDDSADEDGPEVDVARHSSKEGASDGDTLDSKYNLDHYDDEDDGDMDTDALGMAGLSFYESNRQDPYIKTDDRDSDNDSDEAIKPDDNLIALGKVHGDYFSLEIWVSNITDGSHYCHHDAVLSNCPLAIEWVGFDSGDENPLAGNLVAVGSMVPDIELWDVDVVNTLEPAFILKGEGRKKKKSSSGSKKMKRSRGHSDAVLGLSWNRNRQSVLASASADKSVGVWDLIAGEAVSFFRSHGDKAQTVQWHPVEDQLLLSGSYDGSVRLFDCRTEPDSSSRSWCLGGEIEKVVWNHHSPFCAYVGTDAGLLAYIDVRKSDPVYTFPAHTSALTSIILSPTLVNCLVTASNDKSVKLWDVATASESLAPKQVAERLCKIGAVHCGATCPDEPLVVCVGGEREMKVINLQKDSRFVEHFIGGGESDVKVKFETATLPEESLSSSKSVLDEDRKPIKSKKHKKKKKSSKSQKL